MNKPEIHIESDNEYSQRVLEIKQRESFYDFLGLTSKDIELSLFGIDIYIINNKYCLFDGKEMITSSIDSAYGTLGPTQTTLQDAVDLAILHHHN